MGWALPDSPDSYVKLIKAVHRPAFGYTWTRATW